MEDKRLGELTRRAIMGELPDAERSEMWTAITALIQERERARGPPTTEELDEAARRLEGDAWKAEAESIVRQLRGARTGSTNEPSTDQTEHILTRIQRVKMMARVVVALADTEKELAIDPPPNSTLDDRVSVLEKRLGLA